LSDRALCAKPVSPSAVPNYFVCKACKGLLVNCFQTPQGFRLCQVCVNSLHPTHCGPCPGTTDQDNDSNVDGERQRWVCRDRCLPDLATRRELSELWVFCPNADLGCSEQMQWKMLEEHLKQKCEYETVTCQFCLREIIVYKLHLVHCNLESADCCVHFRCHCGYCGFFGYGSDMLNRVDFIKHAKTCSEIPVKCPFAEFGCQVKPKQRQLTEHFSQCNNEHLLMIGCCISAQRWRMDRLEKENQKLKCKSQAQKTTIWYLALFLLVALAILFLGCSIAVCSIWPFSSTSGANLEPVARPSSTALYLIPKIKRLRQSFFSPTGTSQSLESAKASHYATVTYATATVTYRAVMK
ncbi:hypothetical protein BOX15_Mlig031668g2, partial [Macrostomum lignano]